MADLPPPLGALRFEERVPVERRNRGEQLQQTADRRAVAARDVAPGSSLFLSPPLLLPFEAVLTDQALLERCSGSFSLPEEKEGGAAAPLLLRCSRCKVARYSSAAAQKRDWKFSNSSSSSSFGLHSRECSALRAFAAAAGPKAIVPTASVRLAARIFWKRAALLLLEEEEEEEEEQGKKSKKGDGDKDENSSFRFWSSARAVSTLRHHFPSLPDERKFSIAATAAAARSYMYGALTEEEKRRVEKEAAEAEGEAEEESSSSPSPSPSADRRLLGLLLPSPRRLAELLATLSCNAHALSDASQGTLQAYGVGLYPAAAMLNHSCWPSAAVVFRPMSSRIGDGGDEILGDNGAKGLEARALRRLRPGDEATISYVDLCCPRPERRRALLEGYSFDIDADDGDGERLKKSENEIENNEGKDKRDPPPVLARWQGKVPFPPESSSSSLSSSSSFYSVSAELHEALPRTATEREEEEEEEDDDEGGVRRRRPSRAPLERVCFGAEEVAEGAGGIVWIEEEEEEEGEEEEDGGEEEEDGEGEEEEEQEDTAPKESGQQRRGARRRKKVVRVLAWAFPASASSGEDLTSALAAYASTSAAAALAASLSSEALSARDPARALSLARQGRKVLLKSAAAASSARPSPEPESSFAAARLDEALTHAAISAGEICIALEAARRAVPALHLLCSPRGHPPRAFALATLSKLEAAALGNGVEISGGNGSSGSVSAVSPEQVMRAAEVARQAAEEIGVCFPRSEREREFRELAEGLRAEVEAERRMRGGGG